MKEIPLPNKGMVAIVSDRDFKTFGGFRWHAVRDKFSWYAARGKRVNGRKVTIWLHREILGLKVGDGIKVDHRDGNGLHNWKRNLRKASNRQNCMNMRCRSSTGYKGVRRTRNGKFSAYIGVNYEVIYLGTRNTAAEAHSLYARAAKKHFGRFARLK